MNNIHQIATAYYREREAEAMRQQAKVTEPEKKIKNVNVPKSVATPEPVNSKPKNSLIQRIKNFVKHIKTTIHANR
jgi:penicillin V acylase-like amidase (Ntn superfamily)